MKGLGKRLLTAVVAVPLLIGLVGWVPWQGFVALAVVAIGLASWEYLAIILPEETTAMKASVALCTVGTLLASVFLWVPVTKQSWAFLQGTPSLLPASVAFFVMTIAFLYQRGTAADLGPIPSRVGLSWLGCFYLGVCGAHIALLARLPDQADFQVHRGGWVFLLLACTFLSDTGGYFFGIGLKGPKIFPSVSPNKTWSGLLGCIVGAGLGAFAVANILLPHLTWWDCCLLGVGMGLIGQSGDLFESLLKRSHKIKDSGSLLPGHGGMLDRIDALLYNGPLVFYYALWMVIPRY